MTHQPQPIRKSSLPTTPPPEWEFFTFFPYPDDDGGDMVRGQRQRGVQVRRLVTYGDWEPVRPDRWADEPEPAAVSAAVAPPTDRAAVRHEADWIVEHCPDHGCVEPSTEVCHCEIADRLRRMADETATETPAAHATHPCNAATMHRLGNLATAHGPHLWVMQPGMDPVRCPGTRKPAAGARVCKCPPELCACGHHQPAAGARQDGAET